ncbi:glutathione peroxidase [Gammaproteobacteria bacterium]|nr:glutathione peroxidase [Gammaproteobacteria bacterium]MDA7800138.1 glutathione peroxidase [Gammaproteobacteria bacterium]MDA7821335.1 glutathione peroxidase [Gammaproteobacteria bacterium]MDA8862466.1 glutathione peroxidase [Gammaproteobacteria bacterium]MDA8908129.1 glutathione peroxidase [Gammaproteobacteria bacterium]
MSKNIYDYVVKDANMNEISIGSFKNKVLLVVNVASKCGFTYQYEGLQNLYSKYAEDGLEVLGFPCNQFKAQESGTNEEIQFFCTEKYDVSFNVFNKIDVNGKDADPFYNFLKNERPGIMRSKNIKWNFSKFLVNKNGEVVKRYGPTTKPESIESDIIKLL